MSTSNIFRKLSQAGRTAAVLATTFALAAQSSSDISLATAKGIFRDGGSSSNEATARTAIKFDVMLERNGQWTPVSARYEFRSGDKFKFRMQANREGYVYLLNRTFNGDPQQLAAKGIDRVRREDSSRRPDGPTYRLLYPLKSDSNRVAANRWVVLPGEDNFSMDNRAGVEKLYIIVSSKPLKLSDYFNVESGEIRNGSASSGSGNTSRRNDSDDDVLGQLNKQLAEYAENAQIAILEEKGITRTSDPGSYGVVRDSGKPAQFEVSLRHLPR